MREVTLGQLCELIAQAKEGCVNKKNLQCFLANPDAFLQANIVVDHEKSVKDMVSAGRHCGIVLRQIDELLKQSKGENPRVTRENLQAFLRNPDVFLRANIYPVVVDYGKSVEDMVSAGHYDRKNDNINSNNFPVQGEGTVKVNLELVHFWKLVSSEYVLTHLEYNCLRPATVEELLAFGATYPEVQIEDFPIICLGSFWVSPNGDRRVPGLLREGLREFGPKRLLYLRWFDETWRAPCYFLAVRK